MVNTAYATHLKAGQLTASQSSTNSLHYSFTLTVYTDVHAIDHDTTLDLQYAEIDFNDGTVSTVSRTGFKQLDDGTFENTFVFTHTFPAPGNYFVAFYEQNRNANILNIPNSDGVPFYIQTYINISPFTGVNNTPVLTVPPIDDAAVGQIYIHNPGAFDPDGDSLSFKLTFPKQSRNNNVTGYSYPQGVSLDPITGDLIWDRPLVEGLYNIAFIVEEWREGRRISYVLRDMQIEVIESENDPPVLTIPVDTCIIAGSIYRDTIFATDPNGDSVTLTSYGGIYTAAQNISFNTINTGKKDSVASEFYLETECSLVRNEPYQVVFKAEDNPPTDVKLTDLKPLNIRIVAPAPIIDSITGNGNSISLWWEPYICGTSTIMEIYRRDCDSSAFAVSPCDEPTDFPPGYRKIAEVQSSVNTFTDSARISAGSFYCYMLVARFPSPGNGNSIPSEEICAEPARHIPIPLNVDVTETDTLNGKIFLSWSMANPDTLSFPPPYKYIISRAEGIIPGNFSVIDTLDGLSDTSFIDKGINTAEKPYSYRIDLLYGTGNRITATDTSSSVFLEVNPGSLKALLSFNYQVPWNTSEDSRVIYRRKAEDSTYTLLSEIPGYTTNYTDDGLQGKDTVCYYVEVKGRYCHPELPAPLINRSQETCIVPVDSTPPCPPDLFIADVNCQLPDRTFNRPFWKPQLTPPCNDDIVNYNLYFAERADDAAKFLINTQDTFYVHTDSVSLAGCYEVSAVSSLGVESTRSNRVCVDICTDYRLPNLITPNGDGKNDFLVPFPTPRNVQSVEFTVVNRWGGRIFYSKTDTNIHWMGIGNNNNQVSDGVYFYHARVTFKRRLRKEDDIMDLKGWIQVIHGVKEPE